ncbi:MAG: hypothetical protein ACRDJW_08675 [Thermomicrobiales bacterium]
MAATIESPDLSEAWLAALEHLLAVGGKVVNLVTVIESADREDLRIRRQLDAFLLSRRSSKTWRVSTVANTIFPASLYLPRLGKAAREHLYTMHREGDKIRRRLPANRFGNYFDRLIDWPGQKGSFNQLEHVIHRLGDGERRNPLSSAYELALCDPEADETLSADLRIYKPGTDNSPISFPCLSHISLTSVNGVLRMTATYRNQHFLRKAYGNYVGLSGLLRFLAHEADLQPGELVCVATHADAEIGYGRGFGIRDVRALIDACRQALDEPGESELSPPVRPALDQALTQVGA